MHAVVFFFVFFMGLDRGRLRFCKKTEGRPRLDERPNRIPRRRKNTRSVRCRSKETGGIKNDLLGDRCAFY